VLALIRNLWKALRHRPDEMPRKEEGLAPLVIAAMFIALGLTVAGAIGMGRDHTPEASAAGAPAGYTAEEFNDPGLKSGHKVKPPAGPAMSVNVNGQQYLWRYTYSGKQSGTSYRDLVIPKGVTVLLNFTSSDVIHSWWVPDFGGSFDAVPGYVNRGWIRADKTGVFKGASTTMSGSNYQNMTTRVIVLPVKNFEAWVESKATANTDAMNALGALNSGATGATTK
jgi:heme/copper-type cytochrome/quinol oxidase subunit 2